MPHFETTRRIAASPEVIWPILTDAARLQDGTFSILKIEGEIAEGQVIKLWSEADPSRAFAIRVSDVAPPGRMVWSNGLPMGLFRGTRVFEVTPEGEGAVFKMREQYTGLLAGFMFRMIPNLQPTFETFADGLQAAAEGDAG